MSVCRVHVPVTTVTVERSITATSRFIFSTTRLLAPPAAAEDSRYENFIYNNVVTRSDRVAVDSFFTFQRALEAVAA